MFVVRPKADQWIAIYGPDRKLLGTLKIAPGSPNDRGRAGIVLDFDKSLRFDLKYVKHEPPKVAYNPETFGDFEYPDYEVPFDADND